MKEIQIALDSANRIPSCPLRSLSTRNKHQGFSVVRRIVDDFGEDEGERLREDYTLPPLFRRTEKKQLEEGEWEKIHESKVLTVTKLVQYMGFGYEPAWRVNSPREKNQKLDSILLYGKTTEGIAIQVLQKAWADRYNTIEPFEKDTILFSHISNITLTEKSRRDSLFSEPLFSRGRPLYGTPDLVCHSLKEDTNEATIVEIKCPYKQLCLLDLDPEYKLPDNDTLMEYYRAHAPHISKNPTHIRKFLGHVLQVCLYAYLCGKNPEVLSPTTTLKDTCKLVYFFPDIAANTYVFITYDIKYMEWVFDDDTLDEGPVGFHIEDIIREYYQDFVWFSSTQNRMNYRSSSYPLFTRDGDCEYRALSEESSEWYQEQIQGMFSRGINQITLQVIGGENTKEITLSAMDRFLQGRED